MIKEFHVSENLFNATYYDTTNLGASGNNWFVNNGTACVRVPCEPNTTYTFKFFPESESQLGNAFRLAVVNNDDIPSQNEPVSVTIIERLTTDFNPYTFTTLSDSKYILLQLGIGAYVNLLPVTMLVKGSTAPTTYIPYGDTWNTKSYAKSISGAQTYTKFPIVLRTTEQSIPTWNVKGNMQQSGTPTQSSPITPSECGVRTENLFNYSNLETGSINPTNGTNMVNDTQRRTKDYISVSPNTSYILSNIDSGLRVHQYGSDNSYKGSDVYLTTFTTGIDTYKIRIAGNSSNFKENTMLNVGSTPLPYEPYGQYKLPVISGNTTTNIYLSEPLRKIGDYADTIAADGTVTRKIKKIVFDGTENWQGADDAASKYMADITNYKVGSEVTCMSTHYSGANNIVSGDLIPYNSACFYNATYPRYFYLKGSEPITLADFKAYLAQQYAAGTPVTLWYVLATPTTETTTTSAIPTTSGINTIDVATSLKPSEMSLTYDGYKLCKRQRYSRTENLFFKKIPNSNVESNGEVRGYSSGYDFELFVAEVTEGKTYTTDINFLQVYAFYTTEPVIGALSYNNARTVTGQGITTITVPTGSGIKYIAARYSSSITQAMLNTGSTAKPYQPYLDWE